MLAPHPRGTRGDPASIVIEGPIVEGQAVEVAAVAVKAIDKE